MAKQKGTFTWANLASSVANYITNLDGLMDAVAASSTGWSKVKTATQYDTDYVFGVLGHVGGTEIAICVGPGLSPIDASNQSADGCTDDRLYFSLSPARGAGFDHAAGNPRTVDWCDDAGATKFWTLYVGDIHNGVREFNWACDDAYGWLLLEYEHVVGTPVAFFAISGSGDDTLFRSDSLHDGDVYGDFLWNWRGGSLADNDTILGETADRDGVYTTSFSCGIDRTSIKSTYNPVQPWYYAEMICVLSNRGGKGSVDLDNLGWVREGAVVGGDLTSLESGAYLHVTDGMVMVDP